MTHARISPLRQRMIDDMTIRMMAPEAQAGYIRAVNNFTIFLGRSPATARPEDLRRYQLHPACVGTSAPSQNATVTALRFFFEITLGRRGVTDHLPSVRQPRKLPVVLSPDEVARLLGAAPNLKYKAALSIAYGAGLRASEVVSLKVADIPRVKPEGRLARMVIRVEQSLPRTQSGGKGRKDRDAMLSDHLLHLLCAYWRDSRPQGWLFPGQNPVNPRTTRQLNRACRAAAEHAGIDKRVSLHTLRHSFATHLLEQKVDVRVIQVLLGHKKLETAALYAQVATRTLREFRSPFERLAIKGVPPAWNAARCSPPASMSPTSSAPSGPPGAAPTPATSASAS